MSTETSNFATRRAKNKRLLSSVNQLARGGRARRRSLKIRWVKTVQVHRYVKLVHALEVDAVFSEVASD